MSTVAGMSSVVRTCILLEKLKRLTGGKVVPSLVTEVMEQLIVIYTR